METKTFTMFALFTMLTLSLSGPATVQQPGIPEPPLASHAGEKPGVTFSGVEGMVAAQQGAQNVTLVGQIGGGAYAVAVLGNYAYVGVGPRLVILDISNPTHPTVVGQTGVLPTVVRGVAVAGNLSVGYTDVHGWLILPAG